MELLVEKVDGITIVAVKVGFLDASNNRLFKERMNELLPSVKFLLLDLNQVQFVDSSGLAAILTCLKQLSACGGDMKICGATTPVKALFDLVKLNRIVEVCRTREEGVQSFVKKAQE